MDRLNFYILPVANPDGYEYSRSDVSPMVPILLILKVYPHFRSVCGVKIVPESCARRTDGSVIVVAEVST